MVDKFLVNKIREKMKQKNASLEKIKDSFSTIYREKDIAEAIKIYLEEKERRTLDDRSKKIYDTVFVPNKRGKKRGGFLGFLNTFFNNPVFAMGVITIIFCVGLVYLTRMFPEKSNTELSYFFILTFAGLNIIFLFISKLLCWALDFMREHLIEHRTYLRAMQFQIMHILFSIAIYYMIKTQNTTTIISALIVFFVIELVSINYFFIIPFSRAFLFWFVFQIVFWVLIFFLNILISSIFFERTIYGLLIANATNMSLG